MLEPREILIIGASTRAAASSAARAGLSPRCLDQFADADLAARFPVVRFDPSSDADDFESRAKSLGFDDWFYTGSIEGRPDLVDRLRKTGRLLGNPSSVLRRVRDPWDLLRVLRAAGHRTPDLRRLDEAAGSVGGRWLAKSSVTAGGVGVGWEGEPTNRPAADHLQEFVDGPTFSALYVGAKGRARFIGVSRQFHGRSDGDFLYRGGVAPWLSGPEPEIRALGNVLARAYGLVGLFGVDYVQCDGRPLVLEVNPRYTASVELFEAAMGLDLIGDHVRACVDGVLPKGAFSTRGRVAVGKRVIYADRHLTFRGLDLARTHTEGRLGLPEVADVPHAGTEIGSGEPVMTVFATAGSAEECSGELDRVEVLWRDWLIRPAGLASTGRDRPISGRANGSTNHSVFRKSTRSESSCSLRASPPTASEE